jgi:hypothetical protein
VRWWVVLAVLVTVTACESGVEPVAGPANPLAPGRPIQQRAHEATAALDTGAATVDVVSGATTVAVRSADLGPDRIRVVTPDDAAVAPVLDATGDTVTVALRGTGQPGPASVTVLLDRRVRWQVRLSGGATDELLDLRDARLTGVDLAAGATRIELRLPAPDRAVPIRMTGGASELAVHVPAGVATGVRVGGGAGSTEVDGTRRTGLAGGTVLSTATDPDRYDVDAVAGVSTLVLDRS